MMRLILFGLVGLLAGLGGGTGVALMRARTAVPSDSAAVALAAHDSVSADRKAPADRKEADVVVPPAAPDPAPAGAVPAGRGNAKAAPHDSNNALTARRNTVPPDVKPQVTRAALPSSVVDSQRKASGAPAVRAALDSATRAQPLQVKRIAKIFAAMSPKDAATVLQKLDDTDIELIVGSLNEKQAAAILGVFPAERAARLSKAAMRGAGRQP